MLQAQSTLHLLTSPWLCNPIRSQALRLHLRTGRRRANLALLPRRPPALPMQPPLFLLQQPTLRPERRLFPLALTPPAPLQSHFLA